ncbi:hypothetical protein KC799_20435, partial [candidate division KSB1 bacterium]|nr:hypothetical protein [candidate division KSB1 bacterium]
MVKRVFLSISLFLIFLSRNVEAQHPYAKILSSDQNHVDIQFTIPQDAVRLSSFGVQQVLEIDEFISNAPEGGIYLPQAALTLTIPANVRPDIKFNSLKQRTFYAESPARKRQNEMSDIISNPVASGLVSILETGKTNDVSLCVLEINPAQYNLQLKSYIVTDEFTLNITWNTASISSAPPGQVIQKQLPRTNIINQQYIGTWPDDQKQNLTLRKTQQQFQTDLFANIMTQTPGIHAVSIARLADAGFDLRGKNLEELHVYNKNREVPFFLISANKSAFSDEDQIVFRAEDTHGTKTYFSPYSEKNVYQLWHGNGKGLRYLPFDGGLYDANSSAPQWHWDTKHFESDQWFDRLLLQYDGEADHWFWSRLSANQEESIEFEVQNPANVQDSVSFTFAFMGNTYPTYSYTDHSVEVYVNNTFVAQGVWDGQKEFILNTQMPSSVLSDGQNTLTIKAPGNSEAGEIDQFYFNWMEIKYPRGRRVVDNSVELVATTTARVSDFKLEGFSDKDVFILTSDGQQLLNFELTQEADENYSVRFQDNISHTGKIYDVFARGAWESPVSVDVYENAGLLSTANSADYIIVAHKKFIPFLDPLVTWRENQGYRVYVADVQDIFNTFSGGIHTPDAIRDFLKYAYENWQSPHIKYVLLAGDGHYGFFKNRYNETPDYVPTYMAFTSSWGLTSSDNYFAQITGDDILPEIAIGRFPCNTEEELQAMVSKTLNYEQNPDEGVWRSVINLSVGDDASFEEHAEELNDNYIPEAYRVKRIYTREGSRYYGDTAVLVDLFNNGSLLMNFQGHGGGAVFFDSQLFLLEDVASLKNAGRLPVLFSWSCFIGYFDNPHGTSLGEALAREPEHGTVAGFGAAGRAWLFGDRYFNNILYEHLFAEKSQPLGEIIRRAKIDLFTRYGQRDLVLIYNLLGDPALKIQFPTDTLLISAQNSPVTTEKKIDVTVPVPGSSGTLLVESFHDDDFLITSDTLSVNSTQARHSFTLPESVSGEGLIRSYFWNENIHAQGSVAFAIDEIYLSDLFFEPSPPTHNTPFHIITKPYYNKDVRIDSVIFKWQTKTSTSFDSVTFSGIIKDNQEYYQSPVNFQFNGGEEIRYLFRIHALQGDSLKRIETEIKSFKILLQPDLRFAGANVELEGQNDATLKFKITNTGQTSVANFSTGFYQRSEDGAERYELAKVANTPLAAGDTQSVSINWNSPKPGWNHLAIEIDPDRVLDERYTSNNLWNLYLPVGTVNEGTGGAFFTVDSNLSLNIPAATLTSTSVLNVNTWLNYGELINRLPAEVTPLPLKSGYHYFYSIDAGLKNTTFGNNTQVQLYYSKSDTSISNSIATDELRVYFWDFETESFEIMDATHQMTKEFYNVYLSKPGAVGFVRIKDKTSPAIEINVNGKRIIEDEVLPVKPSFTILITDPSGITINTAKLILEFDDQKIDQTN